MTVLSPRTDYHQIAAHAHTALDILTAEAERYDQRTARAVTTMRREIDVLFAADVDELAAAFGARPAPEHWPTAEDFADHLGVDLLVEARWDTARMRQQQQPKVALVNAKLRALWPADVQPGSVTFAELPAEEPFDRDHALSEMVRKAQPLAVLNGPAPDDTLPGREALAPRSAVQAGPRSRFGRWINSQLEQAETWWRRKQAERDARMGVGDERQR